MNSRVFARFWNRWWLPLVVALLAALAQVLGAVDLLRFDRAHMAGQPWRWLTAHWVHLGWMHLGLNMLGLALFWALFGAYLRPRAWSAVFVACSLTVSAGLFLFDPDLVWYVGLSGVLHGLLVVGALAAGRRDPRTAGFVLAIVVAKLVWEQLGGGDVGTAALVGGVVITHAHLYGALGGLFCATVAQVPLLHQLVQVEDRQQDRQHDDQYDAAHGEDQ